MTYCYEGGAAASSSISSILLVLSGIHDDRSMFRDSDHIQGTIGLVPREHVTVTMQISTSFYKPLSARFAGSSSLVRSRLSIIDARYRTEFQRQLAVAPNSKTKATTASVLLQVILIITTF